MTPEALDALVASGATVEMIAAAWKAEMALEDNRSPAARRQARYRQRVTERNEALQNVTRDAAPAPLCPPLKSPPDPQKITPPISPHPSVVARTKNLPPDGVSGAQWQAFLKLRAAKRQPLTEHGYGLLCGKLRGMAEHGFPPGDMIDLAIERGWTTVHEPKENGNGRAGNHKPSGWESAYLANTGEGQSV